MVEESESSRRRARSKGKKRGNPIADRFALNTSQYQSVTMNKPILPSKGCLGSQYFTVSAETAGTLLSQIAGLTSIATEQSLKARDEILRLKREKDVALRGKDEEILQLRKELEIALMNSGANSLADGKNHMNCGNGHNKNVQEKHVVGKQDLRVTGVSPFTDTEGDTSSEGKTTDVMSDSSSDDDWGVSNRERVFGWLPTNAVGWKVATRERDDTSDPPTTDRIPAPLLLIAS